jgi:hypothetical protein
MSSLALMRAFVNTAPADSPKPTSRRPTSRKARPGGTRLSEYVLHVPSPTIVSTARQNTFETGCRSSRGR